MKFGDTIKRVRHGRAGAPEGFTSVVENVNGRMYYRDLTGKSNSVIPVQWEVVAPEFRVEAGKTYLLSDGGIVGPMKEFYPPERFVHELGDGRVWDQTGKARGGSPHPDIQRVFIDIPEGAFVKLTNGTEEGPVERVKCLKVTDLAGFFYRTPQNYNGYYSNGQRLEREAGPQDIVSVVPALKIELGKFYQTRNGRVIGPAKEGFGSTFEFDGPWNKYHRVDGTYWGDDPGLNIVKEVEDPSAAIRLALEAPRFVFSHQIASNWRDAIPKHVNAPFVATKTGAVETTTKTVTEKKIVSGRYGPSKNLIVGKPGTSGERIALKLENRFYSKSDIAEIVSILNGIADALPEART